MNVGVIGSGSIGPDLAYGFLSAIARGGGTVLLHDIRKEALDAGVGRIGKYMEKAIARGKLSEKDAAAMRRQLVPTLELEQLRTCELTLRRPPRTSRPSARSWGTSSASSPGIA